MCFRAKCEKWLQGQLNSQEPRLPIISNQRCPRYQDAVYIKWGLRVRRPRIKFQLSHLELLVAEPNDYFSVFLLTLTVKSYLTAQPTCWAPQPPFFFMPFGILLEANPGYFLCSHQKLLTLSPCLSSATWSSLNTSSCQDDDPNSLLIGPTVPSLSPLCLTWRAILPKATPLTCILQRLCLQTKASLLGRHIWPFLT